MNTIHFDQKMSDDARRKLLYEGHLFVYSPTTATKEFVAFSKELIQEAFGDLEPTTAQFHLPVEEYVEVLKALKPKFIHHPKSKGFLQAILKEKGCSPELTFFDVPRMRTSTSEDYLTSGIAYAFHPHRDTWYSAPMCQLNWWLPIYEVESGNVMAVHPKYFDTPIKNSSDEYNYQDWSAVSRKEAANHIKTDTRKQPCPQEPVELDPQVRIVTEPGGMFIFSAAQLHSSVPNFTGKTRFSIDFRTVHLNDLQNHTGAKNIDSACTGTTLQDYLRISDLEHLPTDLTEAYLVGHPQGIEL